MVPKLLDLVINGSSAYFLSLSFIKCVCVIPFCYYHTYWSSRQKTLTPAKIEFRNWPQACIEIRASSFLDTRTAVKFTVRGLKGVTYIKLGYIFDNREIAETWKLEIRKVSEYPENLALVRLLLLLLFWGRVHSQSLSSTPLYASGSERWRERRNDLNNVSEEDDTT